MGSATICHYVLTSFTSIDETNGFTYSVKQTGIDKSGGVLAPAPYEINGEKIMIEQCGTYDFVFNHNGDVIRIDGFRYSGERNVAVARGIGWSLFITRDDWKVE